MDILGPILLSIVKRVVYMTEIMSWNDDVAYAMTPFKVLTLPLGVWPLQKYNTFSLVRSIVCGFSMVRFQFSYYVFQYNFCIIYKYIQSSSTDQVKRSVQ